jgi:hypothetical protein
VYAPLFSPIRATCPTHLIRLDLIARITFDEEYRSLSPRYVCNLLHSLVTSSLLVPYNFLSSLFLHTLSLCSSLNVIFWHPQKTAGKTKALYILVFKFLDKKLEDKRLRVEWYHAFARYSLFIIFSWMRFWFFRAVPT